MKFKVEAIGKPEYMKDKVDKQGKPYKMDSFLYSGKWYKNKVYDNKRLNIGDVLDGEVREWIAPDGKTYYFFEEVSFADSPATIPSKTVQTQGMVEIMNLLIQINSKLDIIKMNTTPTEKAKPVGARPEDFEPVRFDHTDAVDDPF